ncbi:hypothetical protein A0H81_05914 [Grifola frondosa]|uniref:Uncharacterized protein n=1 Tax=Grifola frondosa TaxID=5627 RepID=A0A1C7MAS1_GRIFR|nr:hypothetical protein A0H81_05914 [Grifola frondosa]
MPRLKCLSRIKKWTLSLMSKCARKPYQVAVETVSDDDEYSPSALPPKPIVTTHCDTQFTSHVGHVMSSTTYHHTSTSKCRHAVHEEPPSTDPDGLDDELILDYLFDDLAMEGMDPEQLVQAFEDDDIHIPRKRTAGDNPLHEWIPEIPTYLNKLICLEGQCGMTTGICLNSTAAHVLEQAIPAIPSTISCDGSKLILNAAISKLSEYAFS